MRFNISTEENKHNTVSSYRCIYCNLLNKVVTSRCQSSSLDVSTVDLTFLPTGDIYINNCSTVMCFLGVEVTTYQYTGVTMHFDAYVLNHAYFCILLCDNQKRAMKINYCLVF